MKKQQFIMVLLMTFLLGACGQDDTPQPTAAIVSEPMKETSPTPTEDAIFQALQEYLGEWRGEWRNITFGSSGGIQATVNAEKDGTLSFTVDLDGFVFGALDPDPISYSGNFDAAGVVFIIPGDPLFGDLSITVTDDGEIAIVGESVPDERIEKISAVGTATPEEIFLEYIVVFAAGNSAVGDMTLTKDSY